VLAAIATEARKFLAKHREQLDDDQQGAARTTRRVPRRAPDVIDTEAKPDSHSYRCTA